VFLTIFEVPQLLVEIAQYPRHRWPILTAVAVSTYGLRTGLPLNVGIA
jgi:hypothetical protein